MKRAIPSFPVQFGRLTALADDQEHPKQHRHPVRCRCSCGTACTVYLNNLKRGNTLSCGCLHYEVCSLVQTTHGLSGSPEYIALRKAITRCENPHGRYYQDYGGRGISVCPEWKRNAALFLEHIGHRPSPSHSLDRFPDNDGNYEPGNVRWATKHQQAINTRANVKAMVGQEILCVAARAVGLPPAVVSTRRRRGWAEADLLMPLGYRRQRQ